MEQGAEHTTGMGQDTLKKKYYAKKLLILLRKRGFSHLRIDDIVRHMDISKATFYKYFASKEDVLEQVVDMVVGHTLDAAKQALDETASYVQRFQDAFEQSLFMTSFISEAFLRDLAQSYPELWERINMAQQKYDKQLEQFYEQGATAGTFQPINPLLLAVQQKRILRIIMDPAFLIKHDLTLRKALYDFYILQKYLVLTPEVRATVDDTSVERYIEGIAHKFSSSMH